MADRQSNPKVDAYLDRAKAWREEFEKLRAILLATDLTEDFKWGHPCYTLEDNNIVLIHGFKDYCALLFFKGALLKDANGILIQQTENVQAARQIRFTGIGEIGQLEPVVRAYVREAIELERSGAKVEFKKTTEFSVPEEFQVRLDGDPSLKVAFAALTPGRQRGYLLHFSGAKQSATRESRIAKCVPLIFDGKGLND